MISMNGHSRLYGISGPFCEKGTAVFFPKEDAVCPYLISAFHSFFLLVTTTQKVTTQIIWKLPHAQNDKPQCVLFTFLETFSGHLEIHF